MAEHPESQFTARDWTCRGACAPKAPRYEYNSIQKVTTGRKAVLFQFAKHPQPEAGRPDDRRRACGRVVCVSKTGRQLPMFGEPLDIDGQCNARLYIGDNYGDGTATMRCQSPLGHDGVHRECFEREGGPVVITWSADERRRCDHGCGQWQDSHHDDNVACPKDADDHEFADCAYCLPDKEAETCVTCGKSTYWLHGHALHCTKGTGRPEDTVACPACGNGPGKSCEGPMSHPSRVHAYDGKLVADDKDEDEFAQ